MQTTSESVYHSLRPLDPSGGLDVLLQLCPRLRKLTLKRTYLPYLALERIVTGLCRSRVTDLDLSECHLDLLHASLIGKLLRKNKLSRLSLRYNRLGERGGLHVSKYLPQATKLRFLDVGWNDIGIKGASAIVDAVNWHLQLNVDCNTIPRLQFLQIKSKIRDFTKEQKERLPKDDDASFLGGHKSLCAALGGDKAISKVIDRFYIYVVTDPSLSKYFRNISMGRMRHLQSSYICAMLGSEKPYRGRDIALGHAHLGITHDHFEQASSWFLQSMRDVCPEVPEVVVEKAIEAINALRPAIVTKDPHKDPSLTGNLLVDDDSDSDGDGARLSDTDTNSDVGACNNSDLSSNPSMSRNSSSCSLVDDSRQTKSEKTSCHEPTSSGGLVDNVLGNLIGHTPPLDANKKKNGYDAKEKTIPAAFSSSEEVDKSPSVATSLPTS